MTRVSRKRLSKDQAHQLTEHFSYLISSLSQPAEIENFFEGFLTSEEKTMLTKRLVLIMMISRGYSTEQIRMVLNVSYETVRSYTNQLSTKNPLFQKTINRLVKRESTKEFWQKIDKFFKPLTLALEAKTNKKARAKFASGDWS